ncbi:NlpC/P60 family peptidoglycan endopeptidase RipB [Mycobacterium ulcerans]|uniref:NlpC/P60 family peptidoglycan endopeptidase RipB n=1 Tax=Mycobacterium ulcerans TaxID=1809 RepID=UPI00106CFBF9|nr:NlpC/P60 family peptidoglycan endopeptidase RipB [Mycobacterium ulcerans]
MRYKRFRLLGLAWITLAVAALMVVVSAPADADPGGWDPTLPATVSAGAPGDALAMANASLQATAQATQTTLDLGRQFLGGLGINLGGSPAPSAANTGANRIPRVYGRQALEYVIRRGGSQMGVPYSWGGGSLQGPSKGVDSGANTVGFDCSGLMRYAFAGVGVLIPRYSGDQYNAGRHISPDQARRGDLIFYGPGGSQHVTMYLGNGQMLEASGSAGKVTVSPVRKAGMTPFVTRIIEY